MDKKILTPELDKMLANKDKSQTIGEFLDWLQNEKKISLCKVQEDGYYPVYTSIQNILGEFFGVDLQKAEKERLAILENLRKK